VETEAITVGDAARRAGLSPKALRLYESLGILAPVQRSPAGYRTYNEQEVRLLRFVRRARALGLTLGEIRTIVAARRRGESPCGVVMELLERHLRDADRRIADLQALREVLGEVLRRARSAAEEGEQVHLCRLTQSVDS